MNKVSFSFEAWAARAVSQFIVIESASIQNKSARQIQRTTETHLCKHFHFRYVLVTSTGYVLDLIKTRFRFDLDPLSFHVFVFLMFIC